jgi:quercetin dioxygenase-like cupin family protein
MGKRDVRVRRGILLTVLAEPGEVIHQPSFGAGIRFLQTARQTNGELLQVAVTLPPRFSMPEHVHPHQEERHTVISGTLRARVGGQQHDYTAGEQVATTRSASSRRFLRRGLK